MLHTFTLTNFKSYRQAELPLGALTVLIGANAAGKSNAIEALRLLSWLAQGQKEGAHLFLPIAAVFEAGNHIAQLQHGLNRRRSAESFSRSIRAALRDEAPWKPIRLFDADELEVWIDEFPDAAMRGLGGTLCAIDTR